MLFSLVRPTSAHTGALDRDATCLVTSVQRQRGVTLQWRPWDNNWENFTETTNTWTLYWRRRVSRVQGKSCQIHVNIDKLCFWREIFGLTAGSRCSRHSSASKWVLLMNNTQRLWLGLLILYRLADQPSKQLSFRSKHRWKRPWLLARTHRILAQIQDGRHEKQWRHKGSKQCWGCDRIAAKCWKRWNK